MDNNALDFDAAKSVSDLFRLDEKQMDHIITEVLDSVRRWEKIADKIGISRNEREMIQGAFQNIKNVEMFTKIIEGHEQTELK